MSNPSTKPKLTVICGPTGIGKTGVAVRMAERLGAEIISADSMQIYRHMDIGTAKPTIQEQSLARHHVIDVVDPDQDFDARRFSHLAREAIEQVQKGGKLPLVVGGTGLYIKALLHGLFESAAVDHSLRERLKTEARNYGVPVLHERLRQVDAAAAARIHPNDGYRVIRALEVHAADGIPISARQHQHGFQNPAYQSLKIGLYMEREALYARIDKRVDIMLHDGLVDETRRLLARGYDASLKSMKALGYRHMADFLSGRIAYEEAVRTLKRDTRRYAKRQMTWFRADPDIIWCRPDEAERIEDLIGRFFKRG